MTTLFVSDLHLSTERPDKFELFEALLAAPASDVEHLYILGDMFEVWLGDDDDTPPAPTTLELIAEFAEKVAPVSVMRGNRDFLMGDGFAEMSRTTLLPDHYVIDLYGTKTLLMHGDLLCTKDIKYMEFRKYVQSPDVQRDFLARSLDERRAIAAETRAGTIASMLEKDDDIMDVDASTVVSTMLEYGVPRMIHGHTHRPGKHIHDSPNGPLERWVLPDWYEGDGVLVADETGLTHLRMADYLSARGAA